MDIVGIISLIVLPISNVISWLAGTRSRKNSVYQEMLATIATLTQQNTDLHAQIIKLQEEVIEVRNENADLKAGQEAMKRQMEELKAENRELKKLISSK